MFASWYGLQLMSCLVEEYYLLGSNAKYFCRKIWIVLMNPILHYQGCYHS
jgi:hypothetical protein